MTCLLCNSKLSKRLMFIDMLKIKVGTIKLKTKDGEEYKIISILEVIFSLYYHTVIPFLLVLFAIYTIVYSYLKKNFEHEIGFTVIFASTVIASTMIYFILEYCVTLIIPLKRIGSGDNPLNNYWVLP